MDHFLELKATSFSTNYREILSILPFEKLEPDVAFEMTYLLDYKDSNDNRCSADQLIGRPVMITTFVGHV